MKIVGGRREKKSEILGGPAEGCPAEGCPAEGCPGGGLSGGGFTGNGVQGSWVQGSVQVFRDENRKQNKNKIEERDE